MTTGTRADEIIRMQMQFAVLQSNPNAARCTRSSFGTMISRSFALIPLVWWCRRRLAMSAIASCSLTRDARCLTTRGKIAEGRQGGRRERQNGMARLKRSWGDAEDCKEPGSAKDRRREKRLEVEVGNFGDASIAMGGGKDPRDPGATRLLGMAFQPLSREWSDGTAQFLERVGRETA